MAEDGIMAITNPHHKHSTNFQPHKPTTSKPVTTKTPLQTQIEKQKLNALVDTQQKQGKPSTVSSAYIRQLYDPEGQEKRQQLINQAVQSTQARWKEYETKSSQGKKQRSNNPTAFAPFGFTRDKKEKRLDGTYAARPGALNPSGYAVSEVVDPSDELTEAEKLEVFDRALKPEYFTDGTIENARREEQEMGANRLGLTGYEWAADKGDNGLRKAIHAVPNYAFDFARRVENLRKHHYDDPNTDKDDPEEELIFDDGSAKADGSNWRSSDLQVFFETDDGRIVGNGPDNKDPYVENGKVVMGDGTKLTTKEYESMKEAFIGLPDGTRVHRTDGSNYREYGTKQVDAGKLNFGTAEPRMPWQDYSGRTMGDEGYQGPQAITEAVPWATDMLLNMATRATRRSGFATAALDSYPAAYGIDPETYIPAGAGLDKIGQLGTFSDEPLTNQQTLARVVNPLVESAIEYGPSGKLIGGWGLNKMFGGKALAGILGSGLEEAGEEMATGLLTIPDDFSDWGKEFQYNRETEEVESVPATMKERIARYLRSNVMDPGLAGFTMGAGMSTVPTILNSRKRDFVRDVKSAKPTNYDADKYNNDKFDADYGETRGR